MHETKIIIEGKIAEIFYLMSKLDTELQLELIENINKRVRILRNE